MIYAKIENGVVLKYPVDQEYVRWNSGNVSFPSGEIPEHVMAEFNCYPVEATTVSFDVNTERAVEIDPIHINGKWSQAWSIIDLTAEEIATRDADQSMQVRTERNALLAASDWTQVADAPVDQSAWASYRQALRDVTGQAGFPWEIVWPTQPE